jgi:hypothetical protein
LPHKVKVALSSGNREGRILAYDFARKTGNVDPLFPNSLKEGREGGTAKCTVMFQHKYSICNVADVEETGMVGNRQGEMVRKIIKGENDRRYWDHGSRVARRRRGVKGHGTWGIGNLFGIGWCGRSGTFMHVKVMGIRFQTHVVLVIRLCITLSGCRHVNIVMCAHGG